MAGPDKKGLAMLILGKKRPMKMGPPAPDEPPLPGESSELDDGDDEDGLEAVMGDFLESMDAKDAAGMAAAFRAALDAAG